MTKIKYILVLLTVLVLAACTKEDVSFTYSPAEPRAGQTIIFSNQTKEGEKWEWSFGDGTTSSSKNPAKVYKRAGEYTVVLKVDEKATRSYSVKITVHDTIPCITLSDSVAYMYQPVKLTAAVYNPYGAKVTYDWHFSENIQVVSGDSTTQNVVVCFTKHSTSIPVSCNVMYDDQPIVLDTAFYVADTVAPALLMTTTDGRLLRQRLFAYGQDEVQDLLVSNQMLTSPLSIAAVGDSVYVFNADPAETGVICVYDWKSRSAGRLAYNAVAAEGQGFYNGVYSDGSLLWTDGKGGTVYSLQPSQTDYAFTAGATSPLYLTDVTQLADFGLVTGSPVGGLAVYNSTYYLAYATGIYRFSGVPTAWTCLGTVLPDLEISRFVIDPVGRKLYYISGGKLYVSGMSGQSPVLISDKVAGTALCLDNAANRLYWSEATGVYAMPLVQTANNVSPDEPVLLNEQTNVAAVAVDAWPRYAAK